MRTLAIDSACSACSAALWADGRLVAERFASMERGHAEALLPMVQEVVAEGGGFALIDLVAVTIGPGSFTGVRTGIAAAQGIARARGLPLVGVTTTEAVALAARRGAPPEAARLPVAVALDSRRADIYLQTFDACLRPLTAPVAVAPDEAAALLPPGAALLAGDAVHRLRAAVAAAGYIDVPAAVSPSAVDVAEIAARRWAGGRGEGPDPGVRPLYLRAPGARIPAAGGRLRP